MQQYKLECKTISPNGAAKASVIWLHGLGANGDDLAALAPEMQIPDGMPIRFIFPDAPAQPVTINGGYSMPAWYDILGLSADSREDQAGVLRAEQWISDLIDQERALGIPSDAIVLAGFSQGGAMAIHTALRYPHRLAGIIALSTYVPLRGLCLTTTSAANRQTPIFFAHGTFDDVVPLSFATHGHTLLTKHDWPVEWHTYPMTHAICPQEISDIRTFLLRQLLPHLQG